MMIFDMYDRPVFVGNTIRIVHMMDKPDYSGRKGVVLDINHAGHLFGTWGDEVVMPNYDSFEIVEE